MKSSRSNVGSSTPDRPRSGFRGLESLHGKPDTDLKLKNGREAHVTMHVLEGSKEEIEKQLKTSLEAFFDFYPEI